MSDNFIYDERPLLVRSIIYDALEPFQGKKITPALHLELSSVIMNLEHKLTEIFGLDNNSEFKAKYWFENNHDIQVQVDEITVEDKLKQYANPTLSTGRYEESNR